MQFTAVDAIVAKLDRAEQHIEDLKPRLDAFLNEAPERELVAYDEEAGEAFKDFHRNRLIPPIFGIITGEVIYQLRSSLDHLTCALILKDGGTLTDQSQFPIFRFTPKEKKEIRRYEGQVKGITRDAVLTAIEGYQPYQRGDARDGHWLAVLKALSNSDKHRALIVNVTHVGPRIRIDTRNTRDGLTGTYHGPDDGAEIPATFTHPDGELVEVVNVERRLTTKIAFAEFGEAPISIELASGLNALRQGTHEIFSNIAQYL